MTAVADPNTDWERTEIPRHKTWKGPLVLPAEHNAQPGTRKCGKCDRKWKGKCPCVYYKRTTTFIDVLQSEFALKKYDRRMVAYGMGQREDLQLAATAVRSDADPDQTEADKAKLQAIADAAKEAAKGSAAATVGTSLHTLTQWLDEGKALGHVPSAYRDDIKAYEEATKGIEWVGIESFRVNDDYLVAGTADRIGWYQGRLRIFDLKTSPKDNAITYPHGPAMQLGMYARSTPYDVRTDKRYEDVAEMDYNVAMVIALPAKSGTCVIKPIDIDKGWQACQLAVRVWKWREDKSLILDHDPAVDMLAMASRATNLKECKMLWANAKEQGVLDATMKAALTQRANELKEL